MSEEKKGGPRKGCLIVVAVIVGLMLIGAIFGGNDKNNGTKGAQAPAATVEQTRADQSVQNGTVAEAAEIAKDDTEHGNLTGPQANAVRSAQQYLAMTGFSRAGLIEQLSSDAGNGYSVADATAAVDSLNADWNENAVKSAKQYLSMTGFSCKGLIEQLSSSAGSKYTVSQATYGAHQAGAC